MIKYLWLVCFLAMPAWAITGDIAGSHDNSKPVEIVADKLEIKQNKQQAIFTGNVEAVQGDVTLKSNQMTVFYREKAKGKQNSVSKIEAKDNVFLATPKETVQGDIGIYDVDRRVIDVKKNVLVTSGNNVVKGNHLVYNMDTGESKMLSQEGDGVSSSGGRVRGVFVPE